MFVVPKWAKFNELTRHWTLDQEFPKRTELFTRHGQDGPTHHEVVAPSPWHVEVRLVDVDRASCLKSP
jgi:hypothetical protein